jgi:hypothetical protein
MKNAKPSMGERISYRVDILMSLNPFFKLFGLFGLTFALVLMGGLVYWVLVKRDDGLIHGLWSSWTFIADAGTQGGEETTLARAVAMVTTIGGMMIFALLLGLVSETLGEKLDDLKKGKSRVIENGHTLILGWSEKVFTLVQQLVEANSNQRRGVIVILSEEDKEAMEAALQDKVGDFKTTVVVCRSGSTTQATDLMKVNAPDARSIVILGDEKDPDESDIRATKTVLALQRAVGDLKGHMVVELMDSGNREMVEMVAQGGAQIVATRDVIGRLMVQTARQNGLAQTYAHLLAFEGSEFYLKEWKELHGKSFGEAWPVFPDAVVCGVKPNPEGPNKVAPGQPAVVLNPGDDYRIGPGDELLFLAEDDDSYEPAAPPSTFRPSKPPAFTPPPRKPESMLFLGWRADLGPMVRELDNYVVPGSYLTLVSMLTREEAAEKLRVEGVVELKNLKLVYKRGNLASRKDLEALNVHEYHTVLVLADETTEHTPDEIDARSLMSLLLIRDIQKKRGVTGIPVLSEIRDPRTKALAAIAEASDYVVSDEIISMLMAQVSERAEMNVVWSDLFDSDGNEIYLKHAHRYSSPGENVTFYDVMGRARGRGEVAIGYRLAKGEDGLVINPADKTTPMTFGAEDRVIVLAQDES